MKRIVSAILVICTLLLCLTSCGPVFRSSIYPEGYIGGVGISYGSGTQLYWVETYEEALECIELLKSHGSTILESLLYSYEGDLFDTKYLFRFCGKKDAAKYGDNLCDRYAENVSVETYGFFEDVDIKDFEYTYISNFDVLYFEPNIDFYRAYNSDEDIDRELFTYESYNSTEIYSFVMYGKTAFAKIYREKNNEQTKLDEECINAILDSLVFIGTE